MDIMFDLLGACCTGGGAEGTELGRDGCCGGEKVLDNLGSTGDCIGVWRETP